MLRAQQAAQRGVGRTLLWSSTAQGLCCRYRGSGDGKTLLLRCLLGLLKESKDIAYAYLFNGRLSPTEFLQYILSDLHLPAAGKSKYELLLDLGHFLISRWSQKMTTVLIVDEAHHLSAEILEEVRLLSNLETTDDKLLQIILAGQPELDDKLDSIELRQLKQRIAVRTQLCPLDASETKRYIEKRLHIAGATLNAKGLFADQTMEAVFRYSQGLPRLINTICENALITAYARNSQSVTPEMIDDVAREFRLGSTDAVLTESSGGESDADVEQVLKDLLNLYSAPRAGVSATTGTLVATEAGQS